MLQPPPELPLPEPPLALGLGHRALLLAAGHLDGLVCPEGEPPHVVRGTCDKQKYLDRTEVDEKDDGSVTTRQIYSEKVSVTVRAVSTDGEIRTFNGN